MFYVIGLLICSIWVVAGTWSVVDVFLEERNSQWYVLWKNSNNKQQAFLFLMSGPCGWAAIFGYYLFCFAIDNIRKIYNALD